MKYEDAKRICESANRSPLLTKFLTPAKNISRDGKSGYCCIFCPSGTGEKGTGAVTVYDDHAKCFSCGKSFRNTDIAAHQLGLSDTTGDNFFKVAEFLAQELNLTYTLEKKKVNTPMKEQKDYSKFYSYAQARLAEFINSTGGTWRGLTLEDLKAVGAGFNQREIDGEQVGCVIFPHNNFSYFERSIIGKVKQHHGTPKVIYNPEDVLNCGRVIFVVEGEIDCITIRKFGYPCIATGGAANWNLLTNFLDDVKPQFAVMFDNNDNGAGQKAASDLVRVLREKGFGAVNFILSPEKKFDANEFLQKDSAGLKARLAEIYSAAQTQLDLLADELKKAAEMAENEKFGTRFNFFFLNKFMDTISRNLKFADVTTGFSNLDEVQEFEAGIFTIGAPPSVGKTTFIWQILEQMARDAARKIHCIFVSYEMSEAVLFSKSVARGVFELSQGRDEYFMPDEVLTSTQIRKGYFGGKGNQWIEDFENVVGEFKAANFDLRVLDLSQAPLSIDDLIKRLAQIAESVPPEDIIVFAVDYLQRIPSKEETAKSAIDYAMLEFKKLSQKTNSIIFLISCYNRTCYRGETGFEAFKESGAIEYCSDVLWALQLYCIGDDGKPSTTQADFDAAKGKQPRPMILKCLKNRFGCDYKLFFKYYSAVETFSACKEGAVMEL